MFFVGEDEQPRDLLVAFKRDKTQMASRGSVAFDLDELAFIPGLGKGGQLQNVVACYIEADLADYGK
jgi:hypothetical protein